MDLPGMPPALSSVENTVPWLSECVSDQSLWDMWFFSHLQAHVLRTGCIRKDWPASSFLSGLSSSVRPWGFYQRDPRFRSWVRSRMEEGRMVQASPFLKRQENNWSALPEVLSQGWVIRGGLVPLRQRSFCGLWRCWQLGWVGHTELDLVLG